MSSAKVLREVSGFIALPITFNVDASVYPHPARHYIYIKAHEPPTPTEDAARSLFLVNIPVTTSEMHVRHLFATQLAAGRVERVEFGDGGGRGQQTNLVTRVRSSKKRKRMTAEELEDELDGVVLPRTVPGEVHGSGASAVVVFVDRPSMEMSLRAARRASRRGGEEVVWGEGMGDNAPLSGLARYEARKTLQFPARADLLRAVDGFMTAYEALEEARSRENAKKRQMPDEDGFVTVTRGAKGGALKKEEADQMREKQLAKQSQHGLQDFYRFQMREKRKEKQGELLRRFEDDKRKVAEMRKRRGQLKPEG